MFSLTNGLVGTYPSGRRVKTPAPQFLTPRVAAVFGSIEQKEKDTFRLLQKSYCAARYEEGFEVGFKELEMVREKLAALISLLRLGIEVV